MTAVLRTLITTLALAAVVLLIFWRLGMDQKQQEIEELTALKLQLEETVKQRGQMIDRLSRSRRIAHIEIMDQDVDASGQVLQTQLRMIELDDNGREIGRQDFTVPGHVVFFDAWTVKFDHEWVASGHPLYGRSLVLLRRVYSDHVPPRDGYPIDLPGAVPPGYAGNDMSRFEQQLWAMFWEIASSAALASEMGVRIAQGEVVYKPVKAGETYELLVDAAGGMNLRPLGQTIATATDR